MNITGLDIQLAAISTDTYFNLFFLSRVLYYMYFFDLWWWFTFLLTKFNMALLGWVDKK